MKSPRLNRIKTLQKGARLDANKKRERGISSESHNDIWKSGPIQSASESF